MAISSCSDFSGLSEINDDINTITAFQEGYDGTKTSLLDGGTQVFWEPNDDIMVFCSESYSKYTSLNTDLSSSAVFARTGSYPLIYKEGYPIWGLYPFSQDASFDGESVKTRLSNNQIGKPGSFAQKAHIALARSNDFNLHFYNVTGGIRFTLVHEGIKYVVIESNGGEPIAGTIRMLFDKGIPIINDIIDGDSRIVLNAPGNGSFEPGKWYYITTLPQTLSGGFKMHFVTASKTAGLTITNSVTIKRGIYGSLKDVDESLDFSPSEKNTSVDLGLSVKWAECNVGATSRDEYGWFYAWGEIETKDYYSIETYKWANNSLMTKYCFIPYMGYGNYADYKYTLDPEDDVAHVKYGGKWRMPTYDEFVELLNTQNNLNYKWEWLSENGHNGLRITYLANGNSIFLPIGGWWFQADNSLENIQGCYWTSSLPSDGHCVLANNFLITYMLQHVMMTQKERSSGASVRPIQEY